MLSTSLGSVAKYNPECPLQGLIAGIGTKLTLFNTEKGPSQHAVGSLISSSTAFIKSSFFHVQSNLVPFDPPIVGSHVCLVFQTFPNAP
jgi:hypothetical protein